MNYIRDASQPALRSACEHFGLRGFEPLFVSDGWQGIRFSQIRLIIPLFRNSKRNSQGPQLGIYRETNITKHVKKI